MVGYDPSARVQLSHTEHIIVGGFSGAVCRLLYQPFDVLKIRFQLQVEPINRKSHHSKYKSLNQAFLTICKEEGWKALWKGHVPAQVLSIGYGGVQFASYEVLTKLFWNFMPVQYSTTSRFSIHTFCGFISGCLATIFIHPVDVLRTRLIAQGEPKIYEGISDATVKIYRIEGIRGFYKGVLPALYQVGPQMGLQFGFYATFTHLLSTFNENTRLAQGVVGSFLCGVSAGIAAKSIIFPLDVVKKRQQIQGFEEARHSFGVVRNYSGILQCFKLILREEGARGFYKGLSPGLIKAGLVAGTNFCIYDQCSKLLRFYHR